MIRVTFPSPPREGLRVLLDLDDTLIVTQARFDAATATAMELISAALRVSAAAVHARFRELDRQAVLSQTSFRVRRYTDSWLAAVAEFAEGPLPAGLKERVEAVTLAVWDPPYDAYGGAETAVQELLAMPGVGTISILTLGDETVQRSKLVSLPPRLVACLSEAVIVPHKDAAALIRALDGHAPENSVMVGNSLRSDIAPALEAGLWAIHVDQDSWAVDGEHAADLDSDRFLRIPSITGLPVAVARILARK